VVDAAAVNAAWYDAVCRAYGLPTRRTADAWTVARRSPGGYPDAVTLSREADAAAVLRGVEGGAGCSVKDSFTVLDLELWGFYMLFEATWIRSPAGEAGSATTFDWHEVQTPADLELWSAGHELDIFRPALLESGDLRFYGTGPTGGAGFALNRSRDVVGVSNVFIGSADVVSVWPDQIAVAAQTYPGLDLVGYELGADLDVAQALGFSSLGPLRVWMR